MRAVAASTPASAAAAARRLAQLSGRRVDAHPTVEDLVTREDLDAIAICTPAATHERYLALALHARLHVLCEKPLIWGAQASDAPRVRDISSAFADRDLYLQVITQWPQLLADVAALPDVPPLDRVTSFAMRMEPPVHGRDMLREALPHPASVLTALGADGSIDGVEARWRDDAYVELSATVSRRDGAPLAVTITLATEPTQPRTSSMTLDDARVDRLVLSMDPYRLGLRGPNGVTAGVADPLERCVAAFVRTASGGAGTTAVDDLSVGASLLDALARAGGIGHCAGGAARLAR